MSGVELVLAFLAGVVMGGALDRFVLPLLVDAWIDRNAPAWARSGLTTEQLIYRGRAEGWLVIPSLEPSESGERA